MESLKPDVHGIDITLQVVKLLVAVELKGKRVLCNAYTRSKVISRVLTEENICVYEYLVGDSTGCIVANTLNGKDNMKKDGMRLSRIVTFVNTFLKTTEKQRLQDV